MLKFQVDYTTLKVVYAYITLDAQYYHEESEGKE